MKKIVIATGNINKIKEISKSLKKLKFKIINQKKIGIKNIKEIGTTFIENALLKTKHASKISGLPSIGDDSGIYVDALKGAPGIYSSRFSGKNSSDFNNLKKLLLKMKHIKKYEERTAFFICVMVYLKCFNDPFPIITHGIWKGMIAYHPKGVNGFGYDSIFFDTKMKLTAAELNNKQKNNLSHRGKALRSMVEILSKNNRFN